MKGMTFETLAVALLIWLVLFFIFVMLLYLYVTLPPKIREYRKQRKILHASKLMEAEVIAYRALGWSLSKYDPLRYANLVKPGKDEWLRQVILYISPEFEVQVIKTDEEGTPHEFTLGKKLSE